MRRASRTISARIHRLIGQLRAVEGMIVRKRSCTEILYQVSAVRAGIEQVANILFLRELERLAKTKRWRDPDLAKLIQLYSQTT
ncbi:MAG: metal-sensitive transcriptional regulator [Candidatus Kerfeldbacteria bacterium]|nr:metal-sensitive transcriptional regulator [Candidatus Kerfeldbacteria bacterium]